MIHNTLWTIVLGIIGGIISSLIVSRVLLIQNKFQGELSFVNRIVEKLGYLSAFLDVNKSIFEVFYDEEVKMEKEKKEKGYKTDMEYYAAHSDEDWISKNDVLKMLREEIKQAAETIKNEVSNNSITDIKLSAYLMNVLKYIHNVMSEKELTFYSIRNLKKQEEALREEYDNCIHMSGKSLIKLIIKDKLIITLIVIIIAMIAGTALTALLKV